MFQWLTYIGAFRQLQTHNSRGFWDFAMPGGWFTIIWHFTGIWNPIVETRQGVESPAGVISVFQNYFFKSFESDSKIRIAASKLVKYERCVQLVSRVGMILKKTKITDRKKVQYLDGFKVISIWMTSYSCHSVALAMLVRFVVSASPGLMYYLGCF